MLFQRFKSLRLEGEKLSKRQALEVNHSIRRDWQKLVRDCLYEDVDLKSKVASIHPYIKSYLRLITRPAQLTVNYNFDDTIERLIDQELGSKGDQRHYETVWDACTQLPTDRAVIYHPNGFLPSNLLENPSEHLVFGEDSFADQLIESMAGHYSSLLHHLFKNTCVFIGISLDDGTLKHLLRQSARFNPGHYHYFVAYVDDPRKVDVERQKAIRAANFDIYNLVTLFLTSKEIAGLGELIGASGADYENAAEEVGANSKFHYYLCGAVGAGKTTTLNYLRSLSTHDEWLEPRPPILGKPHTKLTKKQRDQADEWISGQFARKNLKLRNSNDGIHIVDRSPLDPVAFTPPSQWGERAKALVRAISPGRSSRRVQKGHVIFLDNEPRDLVIRNSNRFREGDEPYLKGQQETLKYLYGQGAVSVLDVRGLSTHQVVKRVAQLIHLEGYAPSDLDALLNAVAKGAIKAPTA